MRWLNIISDRLRALTGREAVIRDIDDELRLHIELETESNVRRGMSHSEARRAALLSFGNFDVMRDAAYGVRGGGLMETIWQDIRYGARMLAKHKAFTVVAVLTLALGIGANTAIFSVVNELLLRPLPFRDAGSLVMLWEVSPSGNRQNTISRANFRAWREQAKSFESMAAFYDDRLNLTGVGEPEELSVQLATPELFHVLGVEPILGRAFTEEDGRPGTPDVAVLSYGLWQRRFGGDRGVVGRPITLNGAPVTVVGVMPADFQWHIRTRSGTGRPAEMWSVLAMPDAPPDSSTMRGRFLSAVARLKDGVTPVQADAEMKTIAARTAEDSPRHNKGRSADALPVREQFVGDVRSVLWLLLGAVGFVLLIACANVANLLLARAASREKEIAVRTALGARRTRIMRQLLTESVLLAALGGLLGLGLAWWGIQALMAIAPRELVSLQGVGLNLTVLGWTLGVTLLTGIVFGLAPAFEATRVDLNDTLKEGGKSGSGQSARSRALRSVLVVSEVALALVLLVSAGLLVKSFVRMRNIDTGFDTENVLTMVVRLPSAKYKDDPQQIDFFRRMMERVRALPGVRS
ncbi:MAG TPA: ADOP family duplicated permease, partial [Pyrinomonadaceae bacterium]|nr:ADOP family duplicated permease [Pyrinomonadaceae bacterium]